MRKKNIRALAIAAAVTLAAGTLAGCGSESGQQTAASASSAAVSEASEGTSTADSAAAGTETAAEPAETEADSEAAGSTETQSGTSSAGDAESLAEELLTRHVVPEDEITDEVVEDLIALLKQTYTFEDDVKEISYDAQFQGYLGDAKGWFEELFGDAGITTKRIDDAANQEAVLMERGDLTFANRMLYPYLTYVAQGYDVTAVWQTASPQKDIVSVIVLADAPYKSFADLKGKKIAARSNGCQYAALLELAENQGWTEGTDWEWVDTMQLKEALVAGEVDAVVAHPGTDINSILLDGTAKVIDTCVDGGIYQTNGGSRVVFAPTEFAKNHPNIVRAYLKLYEAIGGYVLDNEQEAADAIETITRVPAESNILWWESGSNTHYSTDLPLSELESRLQTYADWLNEHDPNFPDKIDVASSHAFDEQYFEE